MQAKSFSFFVFVGSTSFFRFFLCSSTAFSWHGKTQKCKTHRFCPSTSAKGGEIVGRGVAGAVWPEVVIVATVWARDLVWHVTWSRGEWACHQDPPSYETVSRATHFMARSGREVSNGHNEIRYKYNTDLHERKGIGIRSFVKLQKKIVIDLNPQNLFSTNFRILKEVSGWGL